jgi:hypothetical protein
VPPYAPPLSLSLEASPAELPGHDIFDGKDMDRTRPHQLHALARQIAHRAVLPRQDRAGRQDAQSQQVGQVLRIGLVVARASALRTV